MLQGLTGWECCARDRFGRGKLEAEAFVGDFRDVCVMQRLRVLGDDVRLFKCYPGDWQVNWSDGVYATHELRRVFAFDANVIGCRLGMFSYCISRGLPCASIVQELHKGQC